jgi:hypothetical protein
MSVGWSERYIYKEKEKDTLLPGLVLLAQLFGATFQVRDSLAEHLLLEPDADYLFAKGVHILQLGVQFRLNWPSLVHLRDDDGGKCQRNGPDVDGRRDGLDCRRSRRFPREWSGKRACRRR